MTRKKYFGGIIFMSELWKNIDIATNYEVSNLGRIRNTKTGQILNPGISGNGYKQVSINFKDTNKFKKQYVHRLVAQYWLENSENKREVNHIILDRTDNRVKNLEWITSFDNQKHKYENGNYKISHRQVVQMDLNGNEISVFGSIVEAVRFLGVSRQGIDKVVHGTYDRKTAHGYLWKFLD